MDCGVFVLIYARSVIFGAEYDYKKMKSVMGRIRHHMANEIRSGTLLVAHDLFGNGIGQLPSADPTNKNLFGTMPPSSTEPLCKICNSGGGRFYICVECRSEVHQSYGSLKGGESYIHNFRCNSCLSSKDSNERPRQICAICGRKDIRLFFALIASSIIMRPV